MSSYIVLLSCESDVDILRTFTADTAGQLNVLGHDCHTLGVDSTQVCVLKETNQVSLSGLLQGQDGRSLESKITLEVLGDLTNQSLEGQLSDEKVGRLLVSTDLTECDSSRTVTVRLLDSTSGRGRLTGCLGGKLLTRSLASRGLSCCLKSRLNSAFNKREMSDKLHV